MTDSELYFQKALKFAKLSYLGILFPPIGITLSLVAHYMLRGLNPSSETEVSDLRQAKRIGHWGGIVSLWPLWGVVIGIFVGLIQGLSGR